MHRIPIKAYIYIYFDLPLETGAGTTSLATRIDEPK